ncbi:hypothetical protein GYMLUDRAFT_249749 [Collybiopsis luxurians FD-317 M1]|uniref:Uncharacterized protein n=1 Tax=Collybiopsis luxurians FD-317 M1 TaxID=944289 RepID=A0A0D0BWP1_9AGAR|nr:hypothetical protein GYMLUDRAFT_249749 [Collybiopsis luxurians FD-317 M1]
MLGKKGQRRAAKENIPRWHKSSLPLSDSPLPLSDPPLPTSPRWSESPPPPPSENPQISRYSTIPMEGLVPSDDSHRLHDIHDILPTYKLFRELLDLQGDYEQWVTQADCATPVTPVAAIKQHVAEAGLLACKLHNLLRSHIPADDYDLCAIHSSVCSMQLALGTRRAIMCFNCLSTLDHHLECPAWDEPMGVLPIGTDEDSLWLFEWTLIPLQKKTTAYLAEWGVLGIETQVRRYSLIALQRAEMDGDTVYQEWRQFFELPQEYFTDKRDTLAFFQEACASVFALGEALVRIGYKLKVLEKRA